MSKLITPVKGIHPKNRIHNYLYKYHYCFYYNKKKKLSLYRDKQSWIVCPDNLPVSYRALSFFDAIKYIIKTKHKSNKNVSKI